MTVKCDSLATCGNVSSKRAQKGLTEAHKTSLALCYLIPLY